MNVSLTQVAPVVLPSGYVPPETTTTTTTATTPALPETTTTTMDVPIEIVSISAAHPGDDVTVTIKTAPGAQVKILFTMPNGTNSAYPADNT